MAERDPASPVWHLRRAGGRLLRNTLAATDGAVAVGALWPRPYLEELTATGNSPDVHAAARALLDGPRTHRITVPDCLTGHQQQELAALAASDKRLAAALAASGPDGDVIQHLTGGPELLHAYTSGGLFTPVEHALITAALDARRLGHQSPFPPRCWRQLPTATCPPGSAQATPTGPLRRSPASPSARGPMAAEPTSAMPSPRSRRCGHDPEMPRPAMSPTTTSTITAATIVSPNTSRPHSGNALLSQTTDVENLVPLSLHAYNTS